MTPKLTHNRQAVLDILTSAPAAISAYDILKLLHAQDAKWKPATVYRALNYLIESDYVHRIESQQKFISCGHKHQQDGRHFLVCDQCGAVEEVVSSDKVFAFFRNLAASHQFQLQHPYLELRGTCLSCQETAG
jgi:Fur family zinc uptake transcriptional regulator